ncbi:Dabb family protein (plasmid) [Coraliomargarita sp. W4R53]
MVFRHLVLFNVREHVDAEAFDHLIGRLRHLGEASEALAWIVVPSLDSRKGRVIVEDSTFTDRATFERFRRSDAHAAIAKELSTAADWWVGDYETTN